MTNIRTLKRFKQDELRNLAEKYYDDDSLKFVDIKIRNINHVFFPQFERYFRLGTLVVLNANGHTTDGKSTLMAELVRIANEKHLKREMKSDYILGNQQEYANWIRINPDETNLMVQIDEWSDMALAGENSTIETKYLNETSNIHAQKFIHRGTCSPREIPDGNAIIQLEVASKDIKKMSTQAYVYYNLTRAGITHPQIIGYIDVDVSKTLNSEWYKKYRVKKFKRIDLLRKEGVSHERELLYAGVIRQIVEEFRYVVLFSSVGEKTITSAVKDVCMEKRIPLTILGRKIALVDEILSMLEMYKEESKLKKAVLKAKKEIDSLGELNASKEMHDRYKVLEVARQRIIDRIAKSWMFIKKKERLYEEYKKIG